MKIKLSLLLLASLTSTAPVQALEYTHIDNKASTLGFVFTQMGVPVEGGFKTFTAQLDFDPARPEAAKAVIELDVASIDAGSTEANDAVTGNDWFNTEAFPKAQFVATQFKALGDNRYQVSGTLSIKGHSQTLAAPFTLQTQGDNAMVDGQFTLKRADFAIGEGTWADVSVVANDIQIKFHFLAKAKD